MEYTITRKLNKTGKRFVYFPTINGKRLTRTNYARKYDARAVVRRAITLYGVDKLNDMFKVEAA